MRPILSILILLLSICLPVKASDPLAVIVASSSPLTTIPLENLKLIYLRKMQIDGDGNPWIPLNLPPIDPLRRSFSMELFTVLPEDQENYWNVQYFNGIMPPKVLTSEESILRFVATTPGAIGYVRKRNADQRVKVLLLLSH